MTLRALFFEGLEQDEAVELVIKYVDQLPNLDLSSRLANNKSAIHQVIQRDSIKIWDGNGGQTNNRGSTEKWQAVIERWRAVGFKVSDKTTWSRGRCPAPHCGGL